jgi:hypothetical protein
MTPNSPLFIIERWRLLTVLSVCLCLLNTSVFWHRSFYRLASVTSLIISTSRSLCLLYNLSFWNPFDNKTLKGKKRMKYKTSDWTSKRHKKSQKIDGILHFRCGNCLTEHNNVFRFSKLINKNFSARFEEQLPKLVYHIFTNKHTLTWPYAYVSCMRMRSVITKLKHFFPLFQVYV